ncbi:hypothetical protein Avbf_17352, partial [Armadillidium vulgare]
RSTKAEIFTLALSLIPIFTNDDVIPPPSLLPNFIYAEYCNKQGCKGSENHEYPEINLIEHLRMFESFRHPLYEYKNSWEKARTYIIDQFQSYGLEIYKQSFRTQVTTHDNTITENPLMRTVIFQEMRQNEALHQNTTVIFVTFDIDTRNYIPSGPGKPGSYFFIQEWLLNYLDGREFIGAFIIDSVSRFNWQNKTQNLINGMQQVFPNAVNVIGSSGYKANFLAVFSRPDKANQKEVERLIWTNEEVNDDKRLRMVRFILRDGIVIPIELITRIKRTQVIDFWSNPKPLPALLITDLGNSRRDFDEESCSDLCNAEDFLKIRRKEILQKLTMTLLQTAIYHQHILDGNHMHGRNSSSQVKNNVSEEKFNYALILMLSLFLKFF